MIKIIIHDEDDIELLIDFINSIRPACPNYASCLSDTCGC